MYFQALGVSLTVLNKLKAQVLGVAAVDVSQETALRVAGLGGIEPERHALAFDQLGQVLLRLGYPIVVRRVGCVDAEQAKRFLTPGGESNLDRVAVNDVRDQRGLLVEGMPVVAAVLEVALMIECDEDAEEKENGHDRPSNPAPPCQLPPHGVGHVVARATESHGGQFNPKWRCV